MYIQHYIKLAHDGKLRASASSKGLVSNGYHWSGGPVYLALHGLGNIIKMNKLAAIIDSIVYEYYETIIDENESFTKRNGEVVQYGLSFLIRNMHGCHMLCNVEELLHCGKGANTCFAIGHVSGCDHSINVYVSVVRTNDL